MEEVQRPVEMTVFRSKLPSGEMNPPAVKAEELTHLSLADSHDLFAEVRKTENTVSAVFTTRAINKRATKLLDRTISEPTRDQRVEAVIVAKACREARHEKSFELGLSKFITSLSMSKARFARALPEGFNSELVKEEVKSLFLEYARKGALSFQEITEQAELVTRYEITEQDFLTLYTSDPKCQAHTRAKLMQINREIRELEKPARELKELKLANIARLEKEAARREQVYLATTAKIEALLQKIELDASAVTDEEEAELDTLEGRVAAQLTSLLEVTTKYDLATDFHRYLEQHVEKLKPSLDQINQLKVDFKALQAPFIGATPSSARTEIITLQTTPRLNDLSDPNRLPALRPLSKVYSNLKEAVEKEQTTLAFRIFYELEQYVSPVEEHENANAAFSAKLEETSDQVDMDANQIFSAFFDNPKGPHKSMIISALSYF